jgi:hypothetical protein
VSVKPNKDGFRRTEYCSKGELEVFAKLRSSGKVSSFRIALCEACGTDIPNSKKYCSAKCKQKHRENGNG